MVRNTACLMDEVVPDIGVAAAAVLGTAVVDIAVAGIVVVEFADSK